MLPADPDGAHDVVARLDDDDAERARFDRRWRRSSRARARRRRSGPRLRSAIPDRAGARRRPWRARGLRLYACIDCGPGRATCSTHACSASVRPAMSLSYRSPDVTFFRSPARPTCPIACCARWRSRRSTIAAPSSRRSAHEVLERSAGRLQDHGAGGRSSRRSGTGAWEASLVNTLSPGDRVLVVRDRRVRAALGGAGAGGLGLDVELVPGDWTRGVDPALVEAKLRGGSRAPDPGGARRAQRDVDRRRPAGCPRSGGRSIARPSGAAARRRGFVARRRSTCATTSGASTSRWRVRRKG